MFGINISFHNYVELRWVGQKSDRPYITLGVGPYKSLGGRPYKTWGGRTYIGLGVGPYKTLGVGPYISLGGRPYKCLGGWPYISLGVGPYKCLGGRPYKSLGVGPYKSLGGRPYIGLGVGPYISLGVGTYFGLTFWIQNWILVMSSLKFGTTAESVWVRNLMQMPMSMSECRLFSPKSLFPSAIVVDQVQSRPNVWRLRSFISSFEVAKSDFWGRQVRFSVRTTNFPSRTNGPSACLLAWLMNFSSTSSSTTTVLHE